MARGGISTLRQPKTFQDALTDPSNLNTHRHSIPSLHGNPFLVCTESMWPSCRPCSFLFRRIQDIRSCVYHPVNDPSIHPASRYDLGWHIVHINAWSPDGILANEATSGKSPESLDPVLVTEALQSQERDRQSQGYPTP